ncbi:glycosyltransferase family 4 protein [Pseudoalteromonas mariniglutinosa]|uniref:glycosyltransferase family 4 protein n=1 Tax=Pseudoalteromonas mariniglutinosa TaxID=206042 RepID=UPI00384D758D
MKVLLISNMGPHIGNPSLGRFVINQYEELKQYDGQVALFLMPKLAYCFNSSLIRYIIFAVKYFVFIFKSLFKKRFDIVHVHFFYPTIFLAIFYKLFINKNVKVIATFHGNDVYSYNPKAFLYRKAMSYVDHAIYVSNRLMHRHHDFTNFKSVLAAGIKNDFKVIEGVEKKYDFIFVGNLELVKGADRLLSVVNNYPNYRFAVVGSGSFASELQKQNYENVSYFPVLDAKALAFLMNESKCLLNLSRNESFGLVITEALSCGICVIATKTDGAIEQLENVDCGCLLEQNYSNLEIHMLYESNIEPNIASENTLQLSNMYRLENICKKIHNIYIAVLNK